MKRKYILIISILLMIFSLSSCANNVELKENEAINQVGKIYFNEKDVVAVILNDLDEQEMDIYRTSIKVDEYGDSLYESALIIPKYNDMKISVYTSNIKGEDVLKDKLLFETKNKENYGFLFHQERPEGMPLIITVEGNGISEEYFYSYNGKDGTPEIEYIRQNK